MFPWLVYFKSKGTTLHDNLQSAMDRSANAGIRLWEDSIGSEAYAETLSKCLKQSGLAMNSMYVGGAWHQEESEKMIAEGLRQALLGKELGVQIVVSNPNPLPDNTDKTDAELSRQREALIEFGRRLKNAGMQLAYHFHAPEFRQGAREVHAMLALTSPDVLKLCLDVEWAFRGCGFSQEAVLALMALYGDRIVSLHIRQDRGGIWHETVTDGDIDYAAVFGELKAHGFSGPVILENCQGEGTNVTMEMEERCRESALYVTRKMRGAGLTI